MARKRRRSALGAVLYSLRYRLGEYATRGFVYCFPYVPYRWVIGFTSVMSQVAFLVLAPYRRRMEENIAATLGQEIPQAKARKKLVSLAWRNFARAVIDTAAVLHFSKEKIISTVTLRGEEHLQAALKQGRGVIALSAHLGDFTLIGARLGMAGYPFSAVVKHPADKRFARLNDDFRARVGMQTIPAKPRREAVRGILRALRDNRIVLVLADEFKSGEIIVDFFGLKVPAPRGPATLALRTGAVTLPMFAVRQEEYDSLVLSIGTPIEPIRSDNLETSIVATTALFTAHLERWIRRYPAQWNWLGLPRGRANLAHGNRTPVTEQATTTSPSQGSSEMSNTGTLSESREI